MKTLTFLLIIAVALPAISQSHTFKALPYSYDALEPYIDAQTIEVHYGKHHRGYYNNFIKAIEGKDELQNSSMHDIFSKVSTYNDAIRNNGGGYWNHEFYWESMTPGGASIPEGALKQKIDADFGSMEALLEAFKKAALSRFGSGWAWLILKDGKLMICSTPNQDNPLMDVVKNQGIPLLTIDVWEHAYYLKYQNKRGDYIDNFFKVVNWKKVSERYDAGKK